MKITVKKTVWMLLSVIICALAMSFVDAVLQPGYLIKSLIKLILFLGVPLLFFLCDGDLREKAKGWLCPNRRGLLPALGFGLAVYGGIVGGYFLLRESFDFSGIVEKLGADAGVNAENFLYVSIYISLVNSFLEEFFFRGFAFLSLKGKMKKGSACLFSAVLFSVYHGGMTVGYYSVGIFLLTLFGLFIAGMFFNILCAKSKNIHLSWFVHMFANFGINTVGMILFGIL